MVLIMNGEGEWAASGRDGSSRWVGEKGGFFCVRVSRL